MPHAGWQGQDRGARAGQASARQTLLCLLMPARHKDPDKRWRYRLPAWPLLSQAALGACGEILARDPHWWSLRSLWRESHHVHLSGSAWNICPAITPAHRSPFRPCNRSSLRATTTKATTSTVFHSPTSPRDFPKIQVHTHTHTQTHTRPRAFTHKISHICIRGHRYAYIYKVCVCVCVCVC